MDNWQPEVISDYLHESFQDTRESYRNTIGRAPNPEKVTGRDHMELEISVLCLCLEWNRPNADDRERLLGAVFLSVVHRAHCSFACTLRYNDDTCYDMQRWARCRDFARRYRARIFKQKLTLLLGE